MVVGVWDVLPAAHPVEDVGVGLRQELFVLVELGAGKSWQVLLREGSQKDVGFLHSGVEAPVDEAAAPLFETFRHGWVRVYIRAYSPAVSRSSMPITPV